MVAARKLATNRQNAQKSTGPRTPEGKARSSRNGTSHGLSGELILTDDERGAILARRRAKIAAECPPAGMTARRPLVDEVAAWR